MGGQLFLQQISQLFPISRGSVCTAQLRNAGEYTGHETLVVPMLHNPGRLSLPKRFIAASLAIRVDNGTLHRAGHES